MVQLAIRCHPRVPVSADGLEGWLERHGDAGATSRSLRVALDRLLELVGRRRLSAAELRILLRLVDREAGIPELAEALDQRPIDVRRCGRRLAARGLVSWRHAGTRKETRVAITPAGLATVRALLTAASGVVEAAATRRL